MTSRRHHLIVAALLAASLGWTSTVVVAPRAYASTTHHLSGTVVRLQGATLTFVQGSDPSAPSATVTLNVGTVLTSHHRPVTSALLLPGARISVTEDPATLVALSIRVSPPRLSHVSGVLLSHSTGALRIETIAGNPDSIVSVRVAPSTLFSERFLTVSATQLEVGQTLHFDVNTFTATASLVRMSPPKSRHYQGTVIALSTSSVTLRLTSTPRGSLLTLRLTPTTAYSEHSLTTTKAALVIGDTVTLTEVRNSATLIRITPPKG